MTQWEKENEKLRELKIKRLEYLDDEDLRKFYENAIEGQKIKMKKMTLEDASKEII